MVGPRDPVVLWSKGICHGCAAAGKRSGDWRGRAGGTGDHLAFADGACGASLSSPNAVGISGRSVVLRSWCRFGCAPSDGAALRGAGDDGRCAGSAGGQGTTGSGASDHTTGAGVADRSGLPQGQGVGLSARGVDDAAAGAARARARAVGRARPAWPIWRKAPSARYSMLAR
jgi:hypothetical protein